MLVFKLHRPAQDGPGLTRRLTFQSQPSWSDLSARIETLFELPLRNIGCSYIDSDGDKVTLSTNDELVEFYQTSLVQGQPVKFTIEDLTNLRRTSSNAPNANRNTFLSETEFFDVGEDWQRLGPPETLAIFPPPPPSFGPHGFIESLHSHSEAESTFKSIEDSEDDSDSDGLPETTVVASTDKGKGKATVLEDFSSTDSVLGEDAPEKPPIHVMNMSSVARSIRSPSVTAGSEQGTVVPAARHTSPAARSPQIPGSLPESAHSPEKAATPEATSTPASQNAVDDPPLAPLEDVTPANSLVGDVASLLAALQRAFSSHPELSEGLRNIMQNATNGVYWTTHREAMHRAAEDVRRQAEETGRAAGEAARRAEEEAARRVAEAVGNIVQALSTSFGSAVRSPTVNDLAEELNRDVSPSAQDPLVDRFPFRPLRRHGTWANPIGRGRGWMRPNGWAHFDRHGSHPFVPPPPPPPHAGSPHPPLFHPPHPHPPPPPGPYRGIHHRLPVHPPPPPVAAQPDQSEPEHISYSEQRQRLKEAKRMYKLEKARYREQAAQRHTAVPTVPAIPPEPNQTASIEKHGPITASNARGKFPGMEVVSVPGWSNPRVIATSTPQRPTVGSPHRRHTSDVGSVTGRHAGPSTSSIHRITRRLADMGFTQQGYKELPEKISAQVGEGELVSREREDDIVTTLLDELLAMSPRSHRASTLIAQSGKGDGIPGSWS